MKRRIWIITFVLGLFLEFALQTFWKGKLGIYWSPVFWMIGGILLCISAYQLAAFRVGFRSIEMRVDRLKRLFAWAIVFISGMLICGFKLSLIFEAFPIDPAQSDVIPSLEFYVKRFLAGEIVYRDLPFAGYNVQPTYFPMLWLPYCISEILQLDYRWTPFILFMAILAIHQILMSKKEQSWLEYLSKLTLPFVFLFVFAAELPHEFGLVVELTPVAFYLVLVLSIWHRSKWFMALGIVLCLLSRYALSFWLPVYLLIYWIEKGFPAVFKVGLWIILGIVLLYILPFLSKDWSALQKGLDYYAKTAEGQWQTQPWQAAGDKPHHLKNGLSYAIYFYDFAPGETATKLSLNKKVHFFASLLAAGLIFSLYLFWRSKKLNIPIFLLISLKFYLIIFYGFFYTPFNYLFQLCFFLNIPIIYGVLFSGHVKKGFLELDRAIE